MENLSAQTVQNYCRACLKELKQRQKCKITNLHIKIRQWLEVTSIDNPLANDIYPNSVCHPCKNKLNDFLKFYEMWKQSEITLQKLIENKDDKSKIQEIPKTNKVDVTELEGNMLAYEIFETEQESIIKTEPNLNDSDSKELLINNDNVTLNHEHIKASGDIENDIDKQDESYKNSSESEVIPTDSESEENDTTTSTNTKSKISSTKDKRMKYSYNFRCDQCKYRCISQQILDIHLRTHYGLKPYQCTKCNDAFDKSNLLLKHLNVIHDEKDLNIICEHEDCSGQFKTTRSYKNHYRQKHISQASNQKQEKSTKSPYRHVCEECGKMYAKLQYFREHQYTHGPKELYPYQCDQCDKAFVKQRTFNEHKLRHAGIKNFECSHCGAKKTTQKELRSHMNSHTHERQYPCPTCSMIFYRSSNRRIHIEVVHQGIRRFTCRFCEQTFGKSDHLKNHELLHTGEKPHECTECGKRFVQKVSLRSHMKTHNK